MSEYMPLMQATASPKLLIGITFELTSFPKVSLLTNCPNPRVLGCHHQIPPIPGEADRSANEQRLPLAVGNLRKRKRSDPFPIQKPVNLDLDVYCSTPQATVHNDGQQATIWRDRDSGKIGAKSVSDRTFSNFAESSTAI